MTSEPRSLSPGANEVLVRAYFDALRRGAIVDALNAFATDATLLGEDGRRRRGIREIAAFFASRRDPMEIHIDELKKSRDSVTARIRVEDARTGQTHGYRDVFRLGRHRIRSLSVEPESDGPATTPKAS
ncbi:MAG TPA: nuclear transport factor 2 family protein [Thermoplasmata archaeon]|nr:nuclear transport factor 2 family protein [Thermoplasmata archaeon]